MKDKLVRIDQAGRIVLPKQVRQELAIQAGDSFTLSIHGAAVSLTPTKEYAGFVRRGKALVFSTSSGECLSPETVIAALEACREASAARVAGRKREP